jgi:hypothetical protein
MTGDTALFLFLATGSLALFIFLSASHWVSTRAGERKARERYALLKKIAEQPTEAGQLVLEMLMNDEARQERKARRRELQARRDMMQSGAILVAVGVGLAIMLAALAPASGVWTTGVIPALIGVVVFAFALGRPSPEPAPGESGAGAGSS